MDDWETKFKQAIIGEVDETHIENIDRNCNDSDLLDADFLHGSVYGSNLGAIQPWLEANADKLKLIHEVIDSFKLTNENDLQLAFSVAIATAKKLDL